MTEHEATDAGELDALGKLLSHGETIRGFARDRA
jgi:hypothetical protein